VVDGITDLFGKWSVRTPTTAWETYGIHLSLNEFIKQINIVIDGITDQFGKWSVRTPTTAWETYGIHLSLNEFIKANKYCN